MDLQTSAIFWSAFWATLLTMSIFQCAMIYYGKLNRGRGFLFYFLLCVICPIGIMLNLFYKPIEERVTTLYDIQSVETYYDEYKWVTKHVYADGEVMLDGGAMPIDQFQIKIVSFDALIGEVTHTSFVKRKDHE